MAGSPTTLELRRGVVGDAPKVAGLFRRARAQMAYLPTLHTAEDEQTYFRQQLREHDSLLGWQNATLVGFAIFGEGWLHHLYVDPEAQNRGVGAQLLSSAKASSTSFREIAETRLGDCSFDRAARGVPQHQDGFGACELARKLHASEQVGIDDVARDSRRENVADALVEHGFHGYA